MAHIVTQWKRSYVTQWKRSSSLARALGFLLLEMMRSHYVAQAIPETHYLPASASQIMGLRVWTAMLRLRISLILLTGPTLVAEGQEMCFFIWSKEAPTFISCWEKQPKMITLHVLSRQCDWAHHKKWLVDLNGPFHPKTLRHRTNDNYLFHHPLWGKNIFLHS